MSEGAARKAAGPVFIKPSLDPTGDAHGAIAITVIMRHAVQRDEGQDRPGHVAGVAADLVAILGPKILFGVPPSRQLQGPGGDGTREVAVAQSPVMPKAVTIQRGENCIADPCSVL